jgi:DNA (cytosine-5)-methyltransferase 1
MNDGLLTVAQAADYLQISQKTVRRLIKSQQIIACRVGSRYWRIMESEIAEYLHSQSNGKRSYSE